MADMPALSAWNEEFRPEESSRYGSLGTWRDWRTVLALTLDNIPLLASELRTILQFASRSSTVSPGHTAKCAAPAADL